MALDRTGITPTDDDGSGTTGTIADAAWVANLADKIDASTATSVLEPNGLFRPTADSIGVKPDAAERFRFTPNGLLINSSEVVAWGSPLTSPDLSLSRGAANRLDLASGDSFRLNAGVLYGGGVVAPLISVAPINTAGIVAYTGGQLVGGLILRDCNGAGRADTVPTAADLLAAIPAAQVGQGFRFTIRNTSGGAFSITVSTATGVTLSGTMTIAQNNSKDFLAVFTNVTPAAEAYTLYSLGTSVF